MPSRHAVVAGVGVEPAAGSVGPVGLPGPVRGAVCPVCFALSPLDDLGSCSANMRQRSPLLVPWAR